MNKLMIEQAVNGYIISDEEGRAWVATSAYDISDVTVKFFKGEYKKEAEIE